MRASLIIFAILPMLGATPAMSKDVLRTLPPPIELFATQLAAECRSGGAGELVLTDHYRDQFPGMPDINGDRKPDCMVYKCMFGCSGKPNAFEGIATPCAWGNLLLSEGDSYKVVFLPGLVSRIEAGPPVRIAVAEPRSLQLNGNFCDDGYPANSQQQVFELKDGRFRLAGMCDDSGCKGLLERLAAMPAP